VIQWLPFERATARPWICQYLSKGCSDTPSEIAHSVLRMGLNRVVLWRTCLRKCESDDWPNFPCLINRGVLIWIVGWQWLVWMLTSPFVEDIHCRTSSVAGNEVRSIGSLFHEVGWALLFFAKGSPLPRRIGRGVPLLMLWWVRKLFSLSSKHSFTPCLIGIYGEVQETQEGRGHLSILSTTNQCNKLFN